LVSRPLALGEEEEEIPDHDCLGATLGGMIMQSCID